MVERNGSQLTSVERLAVEALSLSLRLDKCETPEETIIEFNKINPNGLFISRRERDGPNGNAATETVVYKPHIDNDSPNFTVTPGFGNSFPECCSELSQDDLVFANVLRKRVSDVTHREHELKLMHATPHDQGSAVGFVVRERSEMPISRILSRGQNQKI